MNEQRDEGRFDPTPYLRQLRGKGGGGEYLDVKWRLLWLRKEHPDAAIATEHVTIDLDNQIAIFKATVTLPGRVERREGELDLFHPGGSATGYGSETMRDFGDFIEKAETKAIGRALNALGYGAQFSEREDGGPAEAPAERRAPADQPSRAPGGPGAISAKQGGFIKGLARRAGLSDEELEREAGGPLELLQKGAASALIDRLKALAEGPGETGDLPADHPATPDQVLYLVAVGSRLGFSQERLTEQARDRYGAETLNHLTVAQAADAIAKLDGALTQKEAAARAAARPEPELEEVAV